MVITCIESTSFLRIFPIRFESRNRVYCLEIASFRVVLQNRESRIVNREWDRMAQNENHESVHQRQSESHTHDSRLEFGAVRE